MMIRKWEPAIVIGPDDQGLEMSLEEFEKAIGAEGFKYELIDGRVEVSPLPDLLHDTFEMRLMLLLWRFIDLHPEIANYASPKARIFVPGHRRATCPEPDVSLFPDVPWNQRPLRVNWRDVSPIVVAEVISPGNTSKDLVRKTSSFIWKCRPSENTGSLMAVKMRIFPRFWSIAGAAPNGKSRFTLGRARLIQRSCYPILS